ncbi:MAG: helix-turn-helix domain-containing protein [Desulfobacterales bacterium]|nr:helix-turn-helix domain-containing protein [Desulfobacterales bacterium]
MTGKQDNAILTPEQVANELSLAPETVRALMRRKILPAAKVGGSWRTTRRALYGYLEEQMGLAGRVRAEGRENNGQRVLPIQRRGKTVDKARKSPSERETSEIFFPR